VHGFEVSVERLARRRATCAKRRPKWTIDPWMQNVEARFRRRPERAA
jgi:hypothetical protein